MSVAIARELRRAFAQERPRPREVAVGEMLQADGELDETLERLPLGPRRRPPVRLEEFVDLEVEACVEERGRVPERLGESPRLAIKRACRHRRRRPARARGHRPGVGARVGREPSSADGLGRVRELVQEPSRAGVL